jgi:hypothetical protein
VPSWVLSWGRQFWASSSAASAAMNVWSPAVLSTLASWRPSLRSWARSRLGIWARWREIYKSLLAAEPGRMITGGRHYGSRCSGRLGRRCPSISRCRDRRTSRCATEVSAPRFSGPGDAGDERAEALAADQVDKARWCCSVAWRGAVGRIE